MDTNVSPPAAALPIEINGQTIDPREHYAHDARNTNYIVLTAHHVLSVEEESQLKALGVEFLENLGDECFLCGYQPDDLEVLREVECIRQVDVYRNVFKIPDILENVVVGQADGQNGPLAGSNEVKVDVMVHENVSDLNALADSITVKTGVSRDNMELYEGKIRLSLRRDQLQSIAADDRVRFLEEVATPQYFDSMAKAIISAPIHFKDKTSSTIVEFGGNGQVVAVADSGFDTGSTTDCHPAFRDRLLKISSWGRQNLGVKSENEKLDDPVGHGTHVAGIIVGLEINTTAGLVGGVAPNAKLFFQSTCTKEREPASIADLGNLFGEAHIQHRANVHSNSWGLRPSVSTTGGVITANPRPYGRPAEEIDQFAREHPEMLICFSAGNYNLQVNAADAVSRRPSIGAHAVAKNCLTVGTSGSTRTISSTNKAGNTSSFGLAPDSIDVDSCRGPTKDGRIKPDVVAPGFNIFSAQSRHPRVRRHEDAIVATSAAFADCRWEVRSGSSQATPMVAGCAAVLREILQARLGVAKPPGVLLKALLINGADKLPGVDTSSQGFGRVNLQASADMLCQEPVVLQQAAALLALSTPNGSLIGYPLQQSEKVSFMLSLPANTDAASEFKITLAYNDLSKSQIQNNLNLSVTDNNTGEQKRGMIISDKGKEFKNNVEEVIWSSPSLLGKTITITVVASDILDGKLQDFVLAWSFGRAYGGFSA